MSPAGRCPSTVPGAASGSSQAPGGQRVPSVVAEGLLDDGHASCLGSSSSSALTRPQWGKQGRDGAMGSVGAGRVGGGGGGQGAEQRRPGLGPSLTHLGNLSRCCHHWGGAASERHRVRGDTRDCRAQSLLSLLVLISTAVLQ